MADTFKHHNEIVKIHAQASGKLKKRPQLQQQAQHPKTGQRQQQQGDAFGSVGLKSDAAREKRDIAEL